MQNQYRGEFNPHRLLKHLVDAGVTGRMNAVVAALRQVIENALDAKATDIRIVLEQGKTLRVEDNGTGFLHKDIVSVNSLFCERKQAGKGIGKNNSGRLFTLAVGDGVDLYFQSADFPKVHTLTFGWKQGEDLLRGTLDNPPKEAASVPSWWKMKSGNTGTTVVFRDLQWNRIPKRISDLQRQLSEAIAPWHSGKVTFNGVALPRRQAIHEFMENVSDPHLGDIRLAFYQLAERSRNDAVFLGSNPVCTVAEFLNGITDPSLQNLLPVWMLDNTLMGYVDIPAVNKFKHHDASKVQQDLYRDEELVMRILTFLHELSRKLGDEFDLRETDTEAKASDELLDQVAELLRPQRIVVIPPVTTDGPQQPPRPTAPPTEEIIISPDKVELAFGESQTFVVRRGPGKGSWNTAKCGGSIDATQGKTIRYTAGNTVGTYRLEYLSPDLQRKGVAEIVIVEEIGFRISKKFVSIHPNQQFDLYVRNCDSETVEWTVNCADMTLVPTTDTRGVQVLVHQNCMTTPLPGQKGLPSQGFYKLTARGSNGNEVASMTVVVRPFTKPVIEIDGTIYELTRSSKSSDSVQIIPRVQGYHQMAVNIHAPLLQKAVARGGAQPGLVVLYSAMVYAHLDQVDCNDPREFERILGSLLEKETAKKPTKKS
jgi:hypothetical protein